MNPLSISEGRVADGLDRYFNRDKIEKEIWRKIKQGENILLTAPRRTGKSSILKYLEQVPKTGYTVKYKSVQSVDSINEYFKHLYILLLEEDAVYSHYQRYVKKAAGGLKKIISRIRSISLEGVEIDPNEKIDYFHECKILLKMIPKEADALLLLIDEFPDAVKNIADINPKDALKFLQLNRQLRQGEFSMGFQFIYTGSIGLGNVVNKLGRRDLINDIVNVSVPPLTKPEAAIFIQRLLLGLKKNNCPLPLEDGLIDYILEKDSWLIPYYIQIIISELSDACLENGVKIDKKIIDDVIQKIINDRYKYQDYFDNWKTRLKQAFDADAYRCAMKILNHISTRGVMDWDELNNLFVTFNIEDGKEITDVLEYDGYISRGLEKVYRFNSIILKEWWYINVAT